MKTMKTLSKLFLLVVALASFGAAQTILANTTLSSLTSTSSTGNINVIVVASATGISGPSANSSLTSGLQATSEAQTYLFIDRELDAGKKRQFDHHYGHSRSRVYRSCAAQLGRLGLGHSKRCIRDSGVAEELSVDNPASPKATACVPTSPICHGSKFTSGIVSDCNGNQWVNGDSSQSTRSVNFELPFPNTGATAYSSVGTSTAKATNTMYCTEFSFPYSYKYVTGLAVMNGATATTDKEIAVLYDSGGNLLANSAVAGTVATGASTFQKRAFITPVLCSRSGAIFRLHSGATREPRPR